MEKMYVECFNCHVLHFSHMISRVILRVNSDYFFKQNYLVDLCNGEELFLSLR